MPKQSRGFWVCVYCEQAFDRFEEADYHERTQDCLQHRAAATSIASLAQQPFDPQALLMAPLSEQERQQGALPYEASKQQPIPQRYLPLMGSQEPSHLSASDTLACRSTEIFEVTDTLHFGETAGQSLSPDLGQVGLRCAFCAETSSATESYVFPANIASVGDSVRHAVYQHLMKCDAFPGDYKRQLEEAMNRRKQIKEQGGPAVHEEENNRRELVNFCAMRCQQAGVIDRRGRGMVFHPNAGLPFSQQQPAPQVPAATYLGQGQVPTGPPSQRNPQYDRPVQQYGASQYYPGMPYGDTSTTASTQGRAASKQEDDSELEPTPINPPPSAAAVASLRYQQQQPQHIQTLQQQYSSVPSNFPFFYQEGRWICRFCSHVPPHYRDPQYFWLNNINTPPPPSFIDYHLSLCREFNRGMMYEQPFNSRVAMESPSFESAGGEQQRGMVPTTPRQRPGSPGAVPSPYRTPAYPTLPPQQQHAIAPTPISTQPPSVDDVAAARAVEYLEANDKSLFDNDGRPVKESEKLVLEEDSLLLTDYFYYLMKQLRCVRFSEADRRTRGGKREKIKVGYGGLQCVHCVDIPNTRKFFWSNVDRLANSFAEIPGHVLKCRRCPQPCKDALLLLKKRHPEQMSRLPRGSQKIFFRRMWRRLHNDDPVDPADVHTQQQFLSPALFSTGIAPPSAREQLRPPALDTKPAAVPSGQDSSPGITSSSEESVFFLQRPSSEAAKALATASIQPSPPSPNSRVLLAIPEDKEWLSDMDCFIRRQLEVFCATSEDVEQAKEDRKYPVQEGQVGIRCIHCALTRDGAKGQAVAYPFAISGIYEAAREFQRLHLDACENLPLSAKAKLGSLKGASSLTSVLRKYFILSAKALGLKDTMNGIRAGAEAVPIGSQAAFAFSEESPQGSEEMKRQEGEMGEITVPASAQKKRKAERKEGEDPDSKRPAVARAPGTSDTREI